SPYVEPTFNYPPPFALVGGFLWGHLGERGFLLFVRQLELVSVAAVAWLAVARARWPGWARWVVAASAVLWAFPVENALFCGNVSPIIVLLTLAGLALAPASPWIAGVLLGAGVAFKPIAAAAVALLAVIGVRRRDAWCRAALAAGATAGALCLLLGARYLPAMWQRASVPAPPEQDLALARGLRSWGLAPSAPLLFLAVAA